MGAKVRKVKEEGGAAVVRSIYQLMTVHISILLHRQFSLTRRDLPSALKTRFVAAAIHCTTRRPRTTFFPITSLSNDQRKKFDKQNSMTNRPRTSPLNKDDQPNPAASRTQNSVWRRRKQARWRRRGPFYKASPKPSQRFQNRARRSSRDSSRRR